VDRSITVVVQQLADLVVTDISVNPAGQVIYSIQNAGSQDIVTPFLVQVYIDSIPVDTNHQVASLPIGQVVSLYVANYTLVGTHRVTVRVNADRALPESNYNNDELTRTLSGATPTLFPTSTWTPMLTPTYAPPPTVTSTPTQGPPPTLTPTTAPPPTPTATMRPAIVSAVIARATPTAYTGRCPGNFAFYAAITTSGAITVTYRWERSDGTTKPPATLLFPRAGSQQVQDRWPSAPSGPGWERIHILAPNDLVSNQATFDNRCR
jgi:hypothetical protein